VAAWREASVDDQRESHTLCCSFCGESPKGVKQLLAVPRTVNICSECIELYKERGLPVLYVDDASPAQDLWTRGTERLRVRLSRKTFQTYFEPIEPVSLVGDELTLAHSSKFVIDWVRDNLLDVLLQDLEAQHGRRCRVKFVVRGRPGPGQGAVSAMGRLRSALREFRAALQRRLPQKAD
jgi:hypothetical protein